MIKHPIKCFSIEILQIPKSGMSHIGIGTLNRKLICDHHSDNNLFLQGPPGIRKDTSRLIDEYLQFLYGNLETHVCEQTHRLRKRDADGFFCRYKKP